MRRAKAPMFVTSLAVIALAGTVFTQALNLPNTQGKRSLIRKVQITRLGQISLKNTQLKAMTLVGGQMVGARANAIDILSESGEVERTVPTQVLNPSISPHGDKKVVIGDLDRRTISVLNLDTGASGQLLDLEEVTDSAPTKVPGISVLKKGKFSAVAGDGKYLYLAISAGFSSSIFKVDPVTKTILQRTWATAPDPEAMTFYKSTIFVLVGGGKQVRKFSTVLQKSHDHFNLGSVSGPGIGVRSGELRLLGQERNQVDRLGTSIVETDRLAVGTNLDRLRLTTRKVTPFTPARPNFQTKYAILICGDLAENMYGECFWNDTFWMYKELLSHGYSAENVFVLYGDGEDFLSENSFYRTNENVTDFAATTNNVEMVLNGLRTGNLVKGIPKMDSNDSLFVWTFDHGVRVWVQREVARGSGLSEESALCLRNGLMYSSDFAQLLNRIPYASRAIFMQQCFSGGFSQSLSNDKTFFAAACQQDEYAWTSDTEREIVNDMEYTHGEFNYYIISALARRTPVPPGSVVRADANKDDILTVVEMFKHNVANNSADESPVSSGGTKVGQQFGFRRFVKK